MAADGHAVFCYGAPEFREQSDGAIIRVVTSCKGDRPSVQLHD